jgi:MtN3 and saliva related transmembrane protein
MITALGLCSGALTTTSFLPQVVRAVRTGSSSDLSWAWLIMLLAGAVGWLGYGLATSSLSVSPANAIMIALVGVLLAVKTRHTMPGHSIPGQPIPGHSIQRHQP